MPIYEYVCVTCGEEFEEIQKFSDPPISGHSCSPKSKVKRKPSLTAFQLKGGGWYKEGYSAADNGNDKGPEKGKDKGDGKSAAPENGKGDTGKSKKSADSSLAEKSPSKPPSSKSDGKPAPASS